MNDLDVLIGILVRARDDMKFAEDIRKGTLVKLPVSKEHAQTMHAAAAHYLELINAEIPQAGAQKT